MTGTLIDKIEKQAEILDEQFDVNVGKSYQLLLQAGNDGMQLIAVDKAKQRVVGYEAFLFQHVTSAELLPEIIETAFQQSKLIAPTYDKVHFIIENELSTLVPDALFDEERIKAYLKFNTELEGNELILSDSIKSIHAHNVFALPIGLKMKFESFFKRVDYHHFSSGLIHSVLQQVKNQQKKLAFLHIHHYHLEVLITENNQLLFYNSFHHRSPEDLLYYILFVYEQLGLNPETTETKIIGEVEKNSENVQLIQKYIRQVSTGQRTDELELCYQMQTYPAHFWYSLLSNYYDK